MIKNEKGFRLLSELSISKSGKCKAGFRASGFRLLSELSISKLLFDSMKNLSWLFPSPLGVIYFQIKLGYVL